MNQLEKILGTLFAVVIVAFALITEIKPSFGQFLDTVLLVFAVIAIPIYYILRN